MIDLFGETPESRSIAILRQFEPDEGYWLAYSGGKDSVVLLEMARRSGVRHDAHYNATGIDPPEVVRFIREHAPEVQFEYPSTPFYVAMRSKGLPTRTARWCCETLKEGGGDGRIVLTGVRAQESSKRAGYTVVRHCRRMDKTLVSPLLHWSTTEVWDFIRSERLPYCCLYDQGWSRIGCIPCPFEMHPERAIARWPRVFDRIKAVVCELFPSKPAWQKRWRSGEEMFAWWIDRRRAYPADEEYQFGLFDQFEE